MICHECNFDYINEDIFVPFITNEGPYLMCPICALKARNEMHGLNDTEFNGNYANDILHEARKEREAFSKKRKNKNE